MICECYKVTTEDWAGSYQMGNIQMVKISLRHLHPNSNMKYRILISGNDDYAMNQDFKTKLEALEILLFVMSWEDVTIEQCENNGFYVY